MYEILDDPSAEDYARSTRTDLSIHSAGGGGYFEFAAIFEMAKRRGAGAWIKGICAGSATLFLGLERVLMKDSGFIGFTEIQVATTGSSEDFAKAAEMCGKLNASMAEIISNGRGATSPDTVREWMAAKRWFSAEDALAAGLVDEIVSHE
jgi:ATP-dependent protease ClpP protease subunit